MDQTVRTSSKGLTRTTYHWAICARQRQHMTITNVTGLTGFTNISKENLFSCIFYTWTLHFSSLQETCTPSLVSSELKVRKLCSRQANSGCCPILCSFYIRKRRNWHNFVAISEPYNWCDLYMRQGFFPRLSVHFIGVSYTRVQPIHGKIRYWDIQSTALHHPMTDTWLRIKQIRKVNTGTDISNNKLVWNWNSWIPNRKIWNAQFTNK